MLLDNLRAQGYQADISSKGKYVSGFVRLLGGEFAMDVLQHSTIQRLFNNAQIRKGRVYSLSELTQIAQPQGDIALFRQMLAALVKQNAFMRGYVLKCPTCDLDAWYRLGSVGEITACQGCGEPIQLPLEIEFAYQPNRLLEEALKSGALTVLLTLYHWLWNSPVLQWEAGIDVQHDADKTDIDLLAKREDGLFLAECKDNFDDSDESLDALMTQLRFSKRIAEDVNATFIFATLYDGELPEILTNYLAANNIQALLRNDLLTP